MNHYSLLELNSLIKDTLSRELEPSYWVVGEIAEMRVNQKGHCYLELVERSDEEVIARVRGTIWAYTFRNLSAWFESMTKQSLQEGLKLLMNVQVQYHEVFGFSFNIRDIDPTYTLGELEKRKSAVLEKLTREGIIEMNRELLLPIVPQRVAVISSPTAAGLEDFNDQLDNNPDGYAIHRKLFKAIMQGQEALHSIPEALRRIHNTVDQYDLVVLIRGGGSQVDLDCFDSYEISSHIAQFPIPVITGIGHERDESIADRVAHTRLKTPTAVAEFILNGFRVFEENLDGLRERLFEEVDNRIEIEKDTLSDFANSLMLLSKGLIQFNKTKLTFYASRFQKEPYNYIKHKQIQLDRFGERLRLLDPRTILKRGYTISTVNGKLLKNQKKLSPGDKMVTLALNLSVESEIMVIDSNGKEE